MNEETNEKVRSLSFNPAAVRMRRYRRPASESLPMSNPTDHDPTENARFLVEIPDSFAVARWGRDADVATICRTIERKLTSEKDGADDEAFWRQMERMPLTR